MKTLGKVVVCTPDSTLLRRKGFTCVDMHVHSTYSDGSATVPELFSSAQKAGIGLAVADHNTSAGSLAILKKNMFAIPAMEVNSVEGPHVLLYFYNARELHQYFETEVRNNRLRDPHGRTNIPLSRILEAAQSYKCITSAPHPFGLGWSNLVKYVRLNHTEKLLDLFDCIEVLSGEQLASWNAKSLRLARQLGKPITGGSDAHTLAEVGRVLTCAKADTVHTFLNAVKAGRTLVVGQQYPLHKLSIAALHALKNHLKHGWFDVGFFLKHGKQECKRLFN